MLVCAFKNNICVCDLIGKVPDMPENMEICKKVLWYMSNLQTKQNNLLKKIHV